MLKVTHLKSSGSAVGKYLKAGLDMADDAAAEYYQADNVPTQWTGKLAEDLGLTGAVDADILSAALDGKLPNGEEMTKHPNRRIGEDFTFSAPKSVSLAALCWGDDRVTAAHDQAVQDTLAWIQRNMIYARHGKGGIDREYNPEIMIASHRHIDARPATLPDGQIFIAPQLHTHCVIPNICRRADGTLGGIKVDMGEGSGLRLMADALYQANLAQRLRSNGIGLRESSNSFELADINDATIAAWSPRTQQIDKELASQGLSRKGSSTNQRQAANLKTRQRKEDMTAAELRKSWATEPPTYYTQPTQETGTAADAVNNALDDLAERQTVIPEMVYRAQAIFRGCAHHTAKELWTAADQSKSAIRLDGGKITTVKAVTDDAYIQAMADHTGITRLVTNVDKWISDTERRQQFTFSADQRRALEYIANDDHKVSLVVGTAGAGKTTAMNAVVIAAMSQGHEVIGLAPSHDAAKALKKDTGLNTLTVASWINQPPKAGNEPRYIIMDEAGMVGSADMAAVIRSLRPQDRLLLVGDPKQLTPVAAGQPYADLLSSNPHATIEQVRRQSDEDQREMVMAFARGDAKGGAASLMQFVEEADDYAAMIEQAADRYAVTEGSTLALASRRQTVADLSVAIRQRVLNTQDLATIQTQGKSAMTKAAMRRKPAYKTGQKIKNPKGTIYTVEAPPIVLDGQPTVTVTDDEGRRYTHRLNDLADEGWRFVEMGALAIAQGDQLLVTDTMNAMTGNGERVKLRNGQALTVQGYQPDTGMIEAKTPENTTVWLDTRQPLPVIYGWARTIHKSQGQTVDNAIVVDDGFSGAQLGYVAASRQRKTLQVFATDADDLSRRLSEWATKTSTLDHSPTAEDAARYAAAKEAALTATIAQNMQQPASTPQDSVYAGYRRP